MKIVWIILLTSLVLLIVTILTYFVLSYVEYKRDLYNVLTRKLLNKKELKEVK